MVRFDNNPYYGRKFVYECGACKTKRDIGNFKPCQVVLHDGIMHDRTLCPADGAYDAKFEEVGQ